MTFSSDILTQISILLLAACGFFVAHYVYNKKRKQEYLVCPIKFDCNTVVNSDYSKFFGIPVEILGMIYYGFTSLSYLFLIFAPSSYPIFLSGTSIALSAVAFIFSLYLMFILAFVLRRGCSWCILSAILCTLIFILTVILYHLGWGSLIFG
ncbi:MAG: vitamin K epoxide reductase family protein [Patescibacteria group bacterium]